MIDLHLSAFAPRWRFLYAVRIDAYERIICFTDHVDYNVAEKNNGIIKDNSKANFIVSVKANGDLR